MNMLSLEFQVSDFNSIVYDRNYLQMPFLNEVKFRITAIMQHLVWFLIHYKMKNRQPSTNFVM